MSDGVTVGEANLAATPGRAQEPGPRAPVVLKTEPHACFGCGELNEAGLHLQLHLEPGRCWTELVIPDRFEGWEGIVHGGIISTILDEVMSWSLIERDSWGVTARPNIDFKQIG